MLLRVPMKRVQFAADRLFYAGVLLDAATKLQEHTKKLTLTLTLTLALALTPNPNPNPDPNPNPNAGPLQA